ncbi:hypothetical protein LR48_Vigan05g224000 [Vigna angularis]|uniref:Uncharacterized protein n=1 Tax=Phaseolus angularis TaxID=3914 RepID=A0A0L9UP06_PHAAN|nr:hypothetical protein LR48_Vigan05g224000 [Vigna angularis]
MPPGKVLQCSKGKGDSRVEMSTGDVASGEDDDHNGETSGGSTAYEGLRAVCLLVDNGGGSGSKHKNESPDELSTNLSCH